MGGAARAAGAVIKVELSVPRESNATPTPAATPVPPAPVADGDAEHEGGHGHQSLISINTWYGRTGVWLGGNVKPWRTQEPKGCHSFRGR